MARKFLRKPSKEKVKASKIKGLLLDERAYGPEPVFERGYVLKGTEFSRTLNWYNYMWDRNETINMIKKWAASQKNPLKKRILAIDDKSWTVTIGHLMRLESCGVVIDRLDELIEKGISRAENVDRMVKRENEALQVRRNNAEIEAIDKTLERKMFLVGELEELLDREKEFDSYDWMTAMNVPSSFGDHFLNYYRPMLEELDEVVDWNDSDLKEGYRHLKTKKEREDLRDRYRSLIEGMERYFYNKKAVRKPRVKKPISAEKKLKNFSLKERDSDYNLVSISPTAIFDSKELWLFDTNQVKLIRLVSSDDGFDVKGKTILGFDPEKSGRKSVKRKTKEVLKEFLDSGKVTRRKIYEDLKGSSSEFSGRVTNQMMLIAAHK